MRFYEILNAYIAQLGCMAKDICEQSGISAATLSRYRSGERLPVLNSDAFEKLCLALAEIAKENGIPEITEDTVREAFLTANDMVPLDSYETCRRAKRGGSHENTLF